MGSLKVFGLPASTDVSRVLTCLFEKEVGFQLIRIDTYNKDHKVPEFLKLQVILIIGNICYDSIPCFGISN